MIILLVATALTVYGIETTSEQLAAAGRLSEVATALTVYGIETKSAPCTNTSDDVRLQQSLPFTVCAEGCETAEEQSDDEVCTSQVPE